MKKFIIILLAFIITLLIHISLKASVNPTAFKEGIITYEPVVVNVSSFGSTGAASAALDVQGTTKGTLISRLTTTQRDAISSPAQGLLIYNISTELLNMYDSTASLWKSTEGANDDLTETTSNILTITGGTGAVLGSGTTIEVDQADTTNSGYLSSTDWNTFNNKLLDPLDNDGDIIINMGGSTGKLEIGSINQVLTVNVGNSIAWETPASGFADPMTSIGSLIYRNGSNVTDELVVGSGSQALIVNASGVPTWSSSLVESTYTTLGVKLGSAEIANNGTATITRQDGYWLTSSTRSSLGRVDIVLTQNFDSIPNCVCTTDEKVDVNCSVYSAAVGSLTIRTYKPEGPASVDEGFTFICIGGK